MINPLQLVLVCDPLLSQRLFVKHLMTVLKYVVPVKSSFYFRLRKAFVMADKVFVFILASFFVISTAHAAPVLFDPKPEDGGFVGLGGVNFTINITDVSLDTDSARVFVISENAYNQEEGWDNFTMQCTNYGGGNWICSRVVSFAIAGTDTLELFYFTANDTAGSQGNLGSSDAPLEFTIDRNPPLITFTDPGEDSYVSGNFTIHVNIYDLVSGVNTSSVRMSFDNSSWSSMNIESNNTFTSSWDTTSYEDNESVTIYVNVADFAYNSITQSINTIVDNEAPNLLVISPTAGSFISGVSLFSVNATDDFAGVDNVRFTMAGSDFSMPCSGDICSFDLDTTVYSDGHKNVTFTVLDNAANINSSSLSIMIKNSESSVFLSAPQYLSGSALITATITNVLGGIDTVSIDIDGPTESSTAMDCNAEFTSCTYLMDTSQFSDGAYTLTAIANSTAGDPSTGTVNVTIDNTNPGITLSIEDIVKDTFTIRATVTDANLDAGSVSAGIASAVLSMSCTPVGASLDCFAQYNSLQLSDGSKELNVTAKDLANNSITESKTVFVDNRAPDFVFLKIVPTYSGSGTEIEFTAGLEDEGTAVVNATVTLRHETFTATLDLEHVTGIWFGKAKISSVGSHKVDINVTDEGGNSAHFENVGYIFIGELLCGDGVCQEEENACLCASDCPAPECEDGKVLGCMSGVPICVTPAKCGDGICSESESCSSCGMDCGECGAIERVSLKKLEISGTSLTVFDISSISRFIEENPVVFTLAIVLAVLAIAFLIRRMKRPKVVKMWELYGQEGKEEK